MANRAYFQMLASLVERLSYIQGSFVSDGSGGVTSVQGSGVDTVVNLQTGVFQIKLQNALLASLGNAVGSGGGITYTVYNGGVVSTVAAGTGFTVAHATSIGQLSVAAQWQAVGLAVGVTPAVGVSFLSNSAGAQAGASATAAAGPLLATATSLGQVVNIVGHPSTTLSTSGTSASGKGGYLVVVFRSGIGVATNPPVGTVRFSMHLRNSSIKGKGE